MLLGDSGVGKTCLLIQFKDGAFLSGTFIATVGIDFRVRWRQALPLSSKPGQARAQAQRAVLSGPGSSKPLWVIPQRAPGVLPLGTTEGARFKESRHGGGALCPPTGSEQ